MRGGCKLGNRGEIALNMQTRRFGQNLRELRTAAGLTQEDLAQRLGFKRTSPISIWERSLGTPTPDNVVKIARAIGCQTAELLRGVQTPYDALRGHAFVAHPTADPKLTDEDRRWLALGRRAGRTLRRSFSELIEATLRAFPNGVADLGDDATPTAAVDGRYRPNATSTHDAPTEATPRARRPARPRGR